jgi:hypothetical protein
MKLPVFIIQIYAVHFSKTYVAFFISLRFTVCQKKKGTAPPPVTFAYWHLSFYIKKTLIIVEVSHGSILIMSVKSCHEDTWGIAFSALRLD